MILYPPLIIWNYIPIPIVSPYGFDFGLLTYAQYDSRREKVLIFMMYKQSAKNIGAFQYTARLSLALLEPFNFGFSSLEYDSGL